MTFLEIARKILNRECRPMTCRKIISIALREGILETKGLTPAATLASQLYVDIQRHGAHSVFVKLKPGIFGLRDDVVKYEAMNSSATSGKSVEDVLFD